MRLRVVLSVLIPALIPAVASAQTAASSGQGPSRDTAGRVSTGGASAGARAGAGATPQIDPDVVSQQAAGSILRASISNPTDPANATFTSVSFFTVPETKPRLIKKHDLVTVIVDETSEYSSAGTTDLSKEADFDAKVTASVRLSLAHFGLVETSQNTNPELGTSGTRDFKGDGSVNRSDSLSARITAEVLDVKPNGTLVLQARQHIKTDDEEQTMILSGNCRVEDVTPDNTVLSTQMFDKDVTKSNKGAVRDAMKRGWVPKLLDAINPF